MIPRTEIQKTDPASPIGLPPPDQTPVGEQTARINNFMSEVCPGILLENPLSCFIGTDVVSRALRKMPAETQGRVLAGLSPYHRQRLFSEVVKGKKPDEIADLLLHMPAGQAPALAAIIPDPARTLVLGALMTCKNPKGSEIAALWDKAYRSEWHVRESADDADIRATLSEMPGEMLMRIHRRERGENSRMSAFFGIEMTARKDRAGLFGNGIDLAGAENHFSNLRVESYQNAGTWVIAGTYKKGGIGMAEEFRYTALPQEYWQELMLDGRIVIPTAGQDQFFHGEIFARARRASLALPKLDPKNPVPKEFGPLSFHRVEVFYEKRKVLRLGDEAGASGGILDSIIGGKEEWVSDDKPQRKYFLTDPEDRLVVIVWNEAADQLSIEIFPNRNQPPFADRSGAVDDKMARGLIPVVRALKGETGEEGQRLEELIKKLEAIAEFR